MAVSSLLHSPEVCNTVSTQKTILSAHDALKFVLYDPGDASFWNLASQGLPLAVAQVILMVASCQMPGLTTRIQKVGIDNHNLHDYRTYQHAPLVRTVPPRLA